MTSHKSLATVFFIVFVVSMASALTVTVAPTTAAPTRVGTLTRAPTAAPTTRAPTAAPTAAPTRSPTAAPTAAPTSQPTPAPTRAPTASPTIKATKTEYTPAVASIVLSKGLVPTALTTVDLEKVQLEIEKLIVSKWATLPTAAAFSTCVAAMSTSGTLGGCCRYGTTNTAAKGFSNDTARAEVLASMVRLAFHDAGPYNVAWNPFATGPNGCIDFNNGDNAGLQTPVSQMASIQQTLYATYGIVITLADLYQFAGLTAVWCSLPELPTGSSATIMSIGNFKYGRTDEATCDDTGGLPDASLGFNEVYHLATRWGMTMKDAAALMGAHALGTTRVGNSGFTTPMPLCTSVTEGVDYESSTYQFVAGCGGNGATGQWTAKNANLDAQNYYAIMKNFNWNRQVSYVNGNAKYSFVAGASIQKQTLMLNTDIAIFYQAQTDNADDHSIYSGGTSAGCMAAGLTYMSGGSNCKLWDASICPVEGACTITDKFFKNGTAIIDLAGLFIAYSDSTTSTDYSVFQSNAAMGQELWYVDFISAFERMASLGYTNLKTPATMSPTSTPTATPTFGPTTRTPTNAPTTRTPTNAPTTRTPTNTPTVRPAVGR